MSDGSQRHTETDDGEPPRKVELKEQGEERYFDEEYREAIDLFDEAIELDPEYKEAYLFRGNCYQALREYDRALEEYARAIEIDPEYGRAYRNRGNAYNKREEYEKAIEEYDKAVELNPDSEYAVSNRGTVYFNVGEYERAKEDYTRAIELNPDYPPAYLNRIEVHLFLGDLERALEDAQKAYEVSDDQTMTELTLMFVIICKIAVGEDTTEERERYREICSEESIIRWSFKEIESWLDEADVADEKEEKIREVIDVLRGHKDDSSFI